MRRSTLLLGTLSTVGLTACGAPPKPVERGAALLATIRVEACARAHADGSAHPASLAPRQGGAIALATSGARTIAYVADEDADAIRTFDLADANEIGVTKLPGEPAQVLVLPDGRVAVTLRDKNRLAVLEPGATPDAPLDTRCAVPTPVEPFGLALSEDGATLLVTSAWAKKLSAFDATSLAQRFDVSVPREPRAVLVDGERAFVAHVVGATMSVVDLATDKHDVRDVDLRLGAKQGAKLRGGCQGFALAKSIEDDGGAATAEKPLVAGKASPAGSRGRVFAPMVTVDSGDPAVRTAGYGRALDSLAAEAPVVGVVDAGAERPLAKAMLADGARHDGECLLPRAAAATDDGGLLVACLGIDALIEMDGRGLDPARLERQRWAVPGGPLGVAVEAKRGRAVVWSQFARTLTIVDRASGGPPIYARASTRAPSKLTPAMAWGRRLFHRTDDRRISSDGRACASCHPDGREDALTWSTPEGPRQTIMLAGRVSSSAPYGWSGLHESLKDHFANTFQRLGGVGIPDETGAFADLDALGDYVTTLKGPALEGAAGGPDTARVERGRELFFAEEQGCAGCHVGGAGTDRFSHDVGSSMKIDARNAFDTPSLHFVSGTAPYFHDGRFATLDALLAGSDAKMGHTFELSRADVAALEAYLETL